MMPDTSARLTTEETLMVLLYRTIADRERSRIRTILFETWAQCAREERDAHAVRFRAASQDLGYDIALKAFTSFVE
jgi:hypothetical protein